MRSLSLLLVSSLALVACGGAAKVHVVGGEGDKYKCPTGQAAMVLPDADVAVCHDKVVAEFVMCATAIGHGDLEVVAKTKTSGELSGAGVTAAAAHEREEARTQKESASAEILRARARALNACIYIVLGKSAKEAIEMTSEQPAPPSSPPAAPSVQPAPATP